MPCLVSSLDDSESDAGTEAAVAHAGASGAEARSGRLLDFVSDKDADTEAAEVGSGVGAAEGGAGAGVAEAIADAGVAVAIAVAGDAEAIVPHVAEACSKAKTTKGNANMRQLQSTTLATTAPRYTCWATASPGGGQLQMSAGGAGAPRPSGRSWRRS